MGGERTHKAAARSKTQGSKAERDAQTGQFNRGKAREGKWIRPDIASFTLQSHFGLEPKLQNRSQIIPRTLDISTGSKPTQVNFAPKGDIQKHLHHSLPKSRMISVLHGEVLPGDTW